ncbi:sensor histidine kinase [Streptomyces olivaceiscleroticus]|uniref:histidine kinase n=1 Tax=Streptomyces olivaceiscleroticus TaxID=68245 RepID=A0ABN0ZIZ2_9ACTN
MLIFTARWARLAVGLLLGGLTAPAELVCVAVGRLPRSATRRTQPAATGAIGLAEVERRRLAVFHDAELDPPRSGQLALGYLAARWPLGLLGLLVLLTSVIALVYASLLVWAWFVLDVDDPGSVVWSGLGGLFLLFLCAQGARGLAQLDEQAARRFLGPSEMELLRRRVGELAATRAGVVQAVHDERRRIERDLHDGVQQRLAALGLLLGRARRVADPAKRDLLLRQAHEASGQALTELRETAWRIYPAVLDEGGLVAALEGLAEHTALPVEVGYELGDAPPPVPVQAVAYFVAAEAVTNAMKHSGATAASIRVLREDRERRGARVSPQESVIVVRIEDNGTGGAPEAPAGGGLLGLSRRVAALDGRLSVHSPTGGPTVITAELPCG